jgi:hypothetical protein
MRCIYCRSFCVRLTGQRADCLECGKDWTPATDEQHAEIDRILERIAQGGEIDKYLASNKVQ